MGSGKGGPGFPKGGLKKCGETVWLGALREWSEETGVDVDRLSICGGVYLDDPHIGTRFLISWCTSPRCDGSVHSNPDVALDAWEPPNEDPEDSDPIVKAYWAPLA